MAGDRSTTIAALAASFREKLTEAGMGPEVADGITVLLGDLFEQARAQYRQAEALERQVTEAKAQTRELQHIGDQLVRLVEVLQERK